jgi:protein arginine N-methyltransferase 3
MDREGAESSSESDNDMRYDDEDDQWQDAEPDGEAVEIISLFDDAKFSDVKSMLNYCKDKFGFDFIDVQRRLSKFQIGIHVYWPG